MPDSCSIDTYLTNEKIIMKNILTIIVLTNLLSGCTVLAAGAAGAAIANPKGAGQVVTKAGDTVRGVGKKIEEKSE